VSPTGRALVTGATGFLGTHLCNRLLESGAEVHAVSRSDRAEPDLTWHRADVTDIEAVRRLVGTVSPDVIYHLASRVTGSRDVSEVVPTLRANFESTVGVLLGAAECECRRIVLAGSMEEPEPGSGVPGSPYAAAKMAASAYARLFHSTYGLSIVNLRVFMVYGPGQLDLTKLVPYTITSLLSGTAPLLGSGDRPVDWVYVDDVVDGILAAAAAPGGDDGASIDIGSGAFVTIRGMVEKIADRIASDAEPRFGSRPDRPGESVVAANLARARDVLGWAPQTPLTKGLDATVAWYGARAAEGDNTQ
jgi:UDP-glucose 4-epimerase